MAELAGQGFEVTAAGISAASVVAGAGSISSAGEKLNVNGYMVLQSTGTSFLNWYNTSGGTNQKWFRAGFTGANVLSFQTVNDAYTSATEVANLGASGLSLAGGAALGGGTLSAVGEKLNVNGYVVLQSSTTPYLNWYNTGGGSDQKWFRLGMTGADQLSFEKVNDAYSTATVLATLGSGGFAVSGTVSATTNATYGFDAIQAVAGGYGFRSTAINNGGTYYHALFREGTADRGSITSNGSVTSYNTASDRRLKTNVRDITGSGAILDSLRPRVFDWKSGARDTYGFVAQELQLVFPDAVTAGDDDPETISYQWAVDASKLVPVLTAEIQALRARVAALEKAADKPAASDLAAQVAELRRRLDAVEHP